MTTSLSSKPMNNNLPWSWGEAVVSGKQIPGPHPEIMRAATRAVGVRASPGRIYLWLCQLRRAPYSYDWIDNFGRRSPRQADPELCHLERGQSVMTIFTLTDFEPDASITLRMKPGWPRNAFGDLSLQYRAERIDDEFSRLSVVLWMPPIGKVLAKQRRYLLAWGDLMMMRKQLLVLRNLAENDDASGR